MYRMTSLRLARPSGQPTYFSFLFVHHSKLQPEFHSSVAGSRKTMFFSNRLQSVVPTGRRQRGCDEKARLTVL